VLPIKDNIPNPRLPWVTLTLIAANVLAYFLVQHGGLRGVDQAALVDYGAVPYAITHCPLAADGCAPGVPSDTPTLVTLFTSMFMHGGILHLGGNMLFLWIFGPNVEGSMNRVLYIAFYLAGGLVAVLGQTVVDPGSTTVTVGASGAIAAVLGGYAVLFPRARILTIIFVVLFFGVVELPALLVLGFWFVMQLFYGLADLSSTAGGGVAYFAHIGGFVFGLAMVRAFADRRRRGPPPARRVPAF
jgi:membrane associated rhomboid family serine protease